MTNENPNKTNNNDTIPLPSEYQEFISHLPVRFQNSLHVMILPGTNTPRYSLSFEDLYELLTEHKDLLLSLPSLDPVVDLIIACDALLHEQLELIEASLDVITLGVKAKKISPTRIIEYYLFRGDFFWKQNVFGTAIESYQKAMNTMLIFNVVRSLSDLQIPMRIGNYWYEHLDYVKAAKMYEIGLDLTEVALSSGSDRNLHDLQKSYLNQFISSLLTTAQVYVFSSIAYHWESKHEEARVSLLQSIIYLAQALELRVSLISDSAFQNLLAFVIGSYSRFRHLSTPDNEILDVLKALRHPHDTSLLGQLARTLRQYCETEYEPLIYGILITTDSGIKLYSYFTEELIQLNESLTRASGQQETSIMESSDLYSSLFSALGTSLRTAFKRPRDINQIKHGDITILVEKGSYTLSFLFADKETIELREKFKKIVYYLEDHYRHELESFGGMLSDLQSFERFLHEILFGHYKEFKN